MNNSWDASQGKLACKCSHYFLYSPTITEICTYILIHIYEGLGLTEIKIRKKSVNVNHESSVYFEWGTITVGIIKLYYWRLKDIT